MLPIVVVGTVICATIVYTVLKARIQEWFEEPAMNRLSLSKGRGSGQSSDSTQAPTYSVTISDDESDSERGGAAKTYRNKSKFSAFKNMPENSESAEKKVKSSGSLPPLRSSMFDWCPSRKKQPIFVDDDSSDDEHLPAEKRVRKSGACCKPELKCSKAEEMASPKKAMMGDGPPTEISVFDVDTDADDTLEEDYKTLGLTKVKATTSRPEVTVRKTYTVSGIQVQLPVTPYSCQTAVISKIIQACNGEKNCLLESPTGSGKTLALLCGVLAWQDHFKKQMEKEPGDSGKPAYPGSPAGKAESSKWREFEDVFDVEEVVEDRMKRKVPRVYYGTRTHKQIEQIVREFKKTVYRDKRMTILSSREHTCIQVSDRNKTELCNDLLDPKKKSSCPFYAKDFHLRPLSSHVNLPNVGLESPWDIEDYVEIGRNLRTCPYFSARDLMGTAEIIFCPYNYLIDSDIRESLDINLKNEIVILDEAHNIEEICRDVASKECREDHLLLAAHDCRLISDVREETRIANEFRHTYKNIADYLTALAKFINFQKVESVTRNSDDSRSECWTGEQFEALLQMPTAKPLGDFEMFNAAVAAALLDFKNEKEDIARDPVRSRKLMMPVITESTRKILEHLSFGLQMIASPTFRNDYRVCIVEVTVKDSVKPAQDNTWVPARKSSERTRILQMMCMNPAVIFGPIAQTTRSIILASGTLSPTSSFASELGAEFFYTLSAGHVIPKEQVYVRCIPKGPTGKPLKATYQNINQWTFQEELGRLIVDVCAAVPHGILCFFSSYNTLNNHIKRWQETGEKIWERMEGLKSIFVEPRYGGHLADVMQDYRECIKSTSDGPRNSITGAILFAVFRGKVAEGIDFSDNEARCVLAIGIPYAVRMDPSVDMKYTYNDLHHQSKGLLKGGEWYAVQAFRALNQALGRCVRHQNDWGAVLLVDERFQQQANIKYLPRWIQLMLRQNVYYNLQDELVSFVSKLKGEDG